jgi:hypothetical protein
VVMLAAAGGWWHRYGGGRVLGESTEASCREEEDHMGDLHSVHLITV